MTDPRIIPCERCGSEGRLYCGLYEDERDCGECPVCEGTGGEIIETEPVTLDDLMDEELAPASTSMPAPELTGCAANGVGLSLMARDYQTF